MGKDGKDAPRRPSVIPASLPSFSRMRESRVKQSTPYSSPSPREGDAGKRSVARRGCTKFNATPPNHNNDPLSRSAGEG